MAPLHRQYKTARTETRWHLLLKIRQLPIQTSASRGYVLFISGNKRHTKVLKLSAGLRTHPAECSKLGKTRIIKDAGRGVEDLFDGNAEEQMTDSTLEQTMPR